MDFCAEIEQLSEMLAFIREFASQAGILGERLYKLELASEEALVNIISYAYPEKKGKIEIFCNKKENHFEVTLCDLGLPFNPINISREVDVHQPLEERRIGGLGIVLLHKLLDEISYRREADKNVLKLVIRL